MNENIASKGRKRLTRSSKFKTIRIGDSDNCYRKARSNQYINSLKVVQPLNEVSEQLILLHT